MKGFTGTKTFKALLITIVALLILIIFTTAAGGSYLADLLGLVTTPAQSISSSFTDTVTVYLDLDTLTMEELKQYAQELSEYNTTLNAQLTDYEKTKRENEQLRKQLDIEAASEALDKNLKYEAAAVVRHDPNDLFYGFSINKGYFHDVSVNDPVITEKGLVGRVSEVYATTSVVETILSEDVQVAVMSRAHDESGVLGSDLIMADNGVIKMSYLQNDTAIEPGTVITTSGASGMFPADITVGFVTDVLQSETDISKYAMIQPNVDVKSVRDVFVIVGFPGKEEAMSEAAEPEASEEQDTEAVG